MKKFLFFFLFFSSLSYAKSADIFDGFNSCYWYSEKIQTQIPTNDICNDGVSYSEKGINLCQNNRTTELTAASCLKKETDAFQKSVLDTLNADNGSNANFISEKGILELRKQHQCLEKICHDVFEACSSSQGPTYSTGNWCSTQVQNLERISQTKLEVVASGNQARKNRSLLKEKFMAIATRFSSNGYFQYWMPKVVNGIKDFTDKVNFFIMFPF